MAVATTLVSYGGFLAACGWYGAHESGYTTMHSLYAGLGSGALMVLCGAGSVGSPVKGDPTYKRWMIAVHVGLMLNALYIVVFGIQFARSRGLPEKADRNFLFMLMTFGSVMSLYTLVKLKPKKKKE
mmetsp:Transcript_25991/g.79959  ORF Transcript_25991/g.79959 Transcript_25991/m.79959 type:complete len:127 (-) Transcript_25991:72-452(-)